MSARVQMQLCGSNLIALSLAKSSPRPCYSTTSLHQFSCRSGAPWPGRPLPRHQQPLSGFRKFHACSRIQAAAQAAQAADSGGEQEEGVVSASSGSSAEQSSSPGPLASGLSRLSTLITTLFPRESSNLVRSAALFRCGAQYGSCLTSMCPVLSKESCVLGPAVWVICAAVAGFKVPPLFSWCVCSLLFFSCQRHSRSMSMDRL